MLIFSSLNQFINSMTRLIRFTTANYYFFSVNNTNYETAGRKPVTQDGDETSQEDADDENDTVDDSTETNEYEEDRNCTCSGSNCMCCINLNLSFIDLGGPGTQLSTPDRWIVRICSMALILICFNF